MNIIQIRYFLQYQNSASLWGFWKPQEAPNWNLMSVAQMFAVWMYWNSISVAQKVLCLNRLKFILSVAQKFAVWIDWNSDCLLHKSLLFECLLKFRCLLHKSLLFECTEQQTAKQKATTKFPIPKHKWGNRLTMQNRDSSPLHMLLVWSLYSYQPTMKGIIWPSIHQCRIHWKPIIWSVMDKPRLDYQGSSNLLCKPSNFHLT